MTTFTDKELIKEIKERISSLDVRDNIERRAYEIALAALEVEPIGFRCRRNDNLGDWSYVYHREPDDFERKHLVIEGIYAAPPVPVVPEEKPMPNPLSMYAVDAVAAIAEVRGWNACRAAMLQGSQPVSQTYKFPVNTPCQDAPAHIWLQTAGVWPEDGELSELTWCSHNQHHDDTLYVRADLVNGNSPVTPDGWISCSERMPEIRQTVIGWNGYAVRQCVYTRNEYAKTQKGREPRFETLTGIWHGVTHWMPLPEPPQEVNRG
ncbi:DUF551 domain-containing protein [Escherichia coli]|uniref:DUF551 domain-containing protein n=1 Tax=Escherichia coli TaxID=562 RepID=UPI0010675671|nr:DUF551 domain-containing protein [Escherichia coli]TEW32429.1 DUF551 domain-containing protein [Escherichia coli]